jgi:hypothetical protein
LIFGHVGEQSIGHGIQSPFTAMPVAMLPGYRRRCD